MKNDSFYKETERLILRSPVDGDAKTVAALRSTDFVTRYNLYEPCDAGQIKKEFAAYEHILLLSKNTGEIIGCISIREDHTRYRMDSVSLQAWLVRESAYQGYMAEALIPVLEELFRSCERVAIQILSENTASIRLAEKLGFEREGYLKRAIRNSKGEVFDLVLLSLDADSFQNARKR